MTRVVHRTPPVVPLEAEEEGGAAAREEDRGVEEEADEGEGEDHGAGARPDDAQCVARDIRPSVWDYIRSVAVFF